MADAQALKVAAERVAARLPPLLVAAQRVAATVAQGVHGRRRVGQGESFWQFRRHEWSDSRQAIDWRQSAKSQHLFVREQEWEAVQSLWIWCDRSPSMAYASDRRLPQKAERAALLALALAALLVRGGEHVALLARGARPAGGRFGLDRLAEALIRPAGEAAAAGLPRLLPLPRHARLVLIGDFLSPLPAVERLVRGYAARGLQGVLLQVLDPAEETLPFAGRIRFEGAEEEGGTTIGRVESVRGDYQRRLAAHRDGLAAIARPAGWQVLLHRTDRSAEAGLLTLYGALAGPSGHGSMGPGGVGPGGMGPGGGEPADA